MSGELFQFVTLGDASDPQNGRQLTGPAEASGQPSALPQRVAGDSQWIFQESQNRLAMFRAAQQRYAGALRELTRIAEALCPQQWNNQRIDPEVEAISPGAVADMIINSVETQLRLARLASEPDSAAAIERAQKEAEAVRVDNTHLSQRLQLAEDTARRLKAELTGAMVRLESRKKTAPSMDHGLKPAIDVSQPETEARRKPEGLAARAATAGPTTANREPSRQEIRIDDLIRLMATEGLCRPKEIRARLSEMWHISEEKNAQAYIKVATEKGWLEGRPLKLDYKGGANVSVVMLSDAGRRRAGELGLEAVQSQYTIGLAMHKSAEQTYSVLDVADILRECGYLEVDPFPAALIDGPLQYHPDLTACDPGTDETVLIEYERATFKGNSPRLDKWVRAARFGRCTIHLVTPNQDATQQVLREIGSASAAQPGSIREVLTFNITDYRTVEVFGNRTSLWTRADGIGVSGDAPESGG